MKPEFMQQCWAAGQKGFSGIDWLDYYVIYEYRYGHKDELLHTANFDSICEDLQKQFGKKADKKWVTTDFIKREHIVILVYRGFKKGVAEGERVAKKLKENPIYSQDKYEEYQKQAVQERWGIFEEDEWIKRLIDETPALKDLMKEKFFILGDLTAEQILEIIHKYELDCGPGGKIYQSEVETLGQLKLQLDN